MFAPFLHELLKGAELHRTRVSAETGALRGAVGVSLPNTVTEARAYQASLSPRMTLLCLVSQKTRLGFQGSACSLDCGKSWGISSVEKWGKVPV